MSERSNGERRPLAKAVGVLEWMTSAPGERWGVREISRGTGMSPSTVHRALTMLASEGLVGREDETMRYSLGLTFLRLALRVNSRTTVVTVALPVMRRLVERLDETVVLGVYDRMHEQMFFAASVESTQQLRYVVPLNEEIPVYLGASGYAILAHLPDADRRRIIERAKLDAKQVEASCRRIREQGYARSQGQRIPGAVGIAAPIFDARMEADRPVIGDLVVTIPEQRFDEANEAEVAAAVKAAAAEISSVGATA